MSLKNIYKEIENDVGKTQNSDGCLKIGQNRSAFVEFFSYRRSWKASSHSNIGWHEFIIKILKTLKQKKNIVLFYGAIMLLNFQNILIKYNNLILKSSHPSPLSAHKGFFGSNHFF